MEPVRDSAPERDGQAVRLEVPARPGYVVLARLALSAVCRLTPLDPETVADLKLAVTEAAGTFVGRDEPATPSSPAPDERTVQFTFDLRERELLVEIDCEGGADLSEAEGELSRAIIAATVDAWHSQLGRIVLVKRLPAESLGSSTDR
jgi:hypothetical protein